MLGLWFAMQLVSGLAAAPGRPGVAFWAHVGGFAAGMALILLLRPRRVALLEPQKTPVFATAPPRRWPAGGPFTRRLGPGRRPLAVSPAAGLVKIRRSTTATIP